MISQFTRDDKNDIEYFWINNYVYDQDEFILRKVKNNYQGIYLTDGYVYKLNKKEIDTFVKLLPKWRLEILYDGGKIKNNSPEEVIEMHLAWERQIVYLKQQRKKKVRPPRRNKIIFVLN